MNFKSLMLGAAAAVAATGASAADLPVAPEPVDYVKVCDTYGATFYYIPGTETCLRVGGRVRVQYTLNNMAKNGAFDSYTSDNYGMYGKAYLFLDSRTSTEFGLLRTFAEMDMTSGLGGTEAIDLGKAYIQWGGFTFGYATSFFDYSTGTAAIGIVSRYASDKTTNLLGYTAAFGNMTASIAIEDGAVRETGTYFGATYPDVVAALGYSEGIVDAKLSGALHHVNTTVGKRSMGWAIGAGVTFDLPMISSGTSVVFQGQYADGALSYIGAPNGFSTTNAGGVTDMTNGKKNKGYSLLAGIKHQATDTVALALDGNYAKVDVNGANNDVTSWSIDGSVAWTPVSGFTMSADVGYQDLDVQGAADQDAILAAFRVQRDF
ncbi:MAG: porin [Rhodobacteraceae bacterium]|nr:porin [Paracoccaceae bacterium]